ncbi:MAG: hypothetical protein IPI03_09025 [Rubrivivax sp.]|jgi:hypothetical protein|nr:hypothetical protein [Rubrivivax sp.]MBK7261987.1 hypothetical protein [Rubrivivax sp.]MBK8528196.1 hypothetical protein [Rubrivivax sp.]
MTWPGVPIVEPGAGLGATIAKLLALVKAGRNGRGSGAGRSAETTVIY